eukprot:jgi/Tetstr1/436915/TSEL_025688.t1
MSRGSASRRQMHGGKQVCAGVIGDAGAGESWMKAHICGDEEGPEGDYRFRHAQCTKGIDGMKDNLKGLAV